MSRTGSQTSFASGGVARPSAAIAAIETERLATCMLCGSSQLRSWRADARDYQQEHAQQRFAYGECQSCGLCSEVVRPLESELGRIYFTGYGPYREDQSSASSAPPARVATRAVAIAGRALAAALEVVAPSPLESSFADFYTPEAPGKTLLDYGCGAPTFLDSARTRGWETLGADFSEAVLDAVRARGHRTVLAGSELAAKVGDRSVAAIRMNHVIEHLYHPGAVMEGLHRKLEPGGRIHLSTPNPKSLGSRLFRRRWLALDAPRHVALYPPRTLQRLLSGAGFEVSRIVHEVGAKDLARSWGIVLFERGRIAHGQIGAMGEDLTRARLLAPVTKLAAMLSLADRYHVFARARH